MLCGGGCSAEEKGVSCAGRRKQEEYKIKRTFRPITPRQAMEGIAVAMALPASSGLCRRAGGGIVLGDLLCVQCSDAELYLQVRKY